MFLRYLCRGDAMVAGREDGPEIVYSADLVPDFANRATLGYLEGLVCEAWHDPDAHLMRLTGLHTSGRWAVAGNPPAGVLSRMAPEGYPTRAEACIAAMEAAKEVQS